jgi:cell division septal protein FtsQ
MDIKVEVSLPAEVFISVKEREAVMMWKQNNALR